MLDESMLEKLESRLEEEFTGYTEVAGGKNYRLRHLKSVRKIALKLAEKVDAELDEKVLEVAALYHDIGRVKDIENGEMNPFKGHEGHDEKGAEIVGEYVSDFVTKEQLEKIEKIIENHHSEPETSEGKIVQDADKIFNVGVNNLWRQFHYSAQNERTLEEGLEYFWNEAVEEYQKLIDNLHFQESRKSAEKRLKKQKQTMKQIQREINAEDI